MHKRIAFAVVLIAVFVVHMASASPPVIADDGSTVIIEVLFVNALSKFFIVKQIGLSKVILEKSPWGMSVFDRMSGQKIVNALIC